MASISTSLLPISMISSSTSLRCLGVTRQFCLLSSSSRSFSDLPVKVFMAVSMAFVSQSISGGLIMISSGGFFMVGSYTVKWFSYCPSSTDLFQERSSSSNSGSLSASATSTPSFIWFSSQSTFTVSDSWEEAPTRLPFSKTRKVKLRASCRQRRAVTASPLQTALPTLLQSITQPQMKMRITRFSMYLILLMRMLPSAKSKNTRKSRPIITIALILSDLEMERQVRAKTRQRLLASEQRWGRKRFFLLMASFGFISISFFLANSLQDEPKQASRQIAPKMIPPISAALSPPSFAVIPSPYTIRNPLIISHPQRRSNSTNLFILVETEQACLLFRSIIIPNPRKGRRKMMQPTLKTENKPSWFASCRFMPQMYRRFLRGTKSREQSCCPSTPTHASDTNMNSSKTPLNDLTSTKPTKITDPVHRRPINAQIRQVSTVQADSSKLEYGFSSRLLVACRGMEVV